MINEIIYRSPFVYKLIMRLLYGRYYEQRLRVIADLIPPESSVLDLCCGPGEIYRRYLKDKLVRYRGLDRSEVFVQRVRELGAEAERVNLRGMIALPPADYVLMQSSFYYFLPDARAILDRMLEAARDAVIVMEPVRNLATSRFPPVRALAQALSRPARGPQARFDEKSLDELFATYGDQLIDVRFIPGGRDKIYILRPPLKQGGSTGRVNSR